MKKLIFTFALIAVAAASFAAGLSDPSTSMTGWTDWGWSGGNISDLADGRGFSVDLTSAPAGTALDKIRGVTFISFNVSGWVYDDNESIVAEIDENFAEADGSYSVSLIVDANGKGALYDTTYTGPGTYVFTEALTAAANMNGLAVTDIWFSLGADKPMTSGDYLTVRFKTGDDEEQLVPEPASVAYGITGLVSLMGIKRRIKK
ncbi:MAG: hypothetical protein J6X38_05260 [Abditibacteriota bacterium]|nr:hypothetical protein [Abditibacteriota bacterium]